MTSSRVVYTAVQESVAQVEGFDGVRAFADASPADIANMGDWMPNTRGKEVRLLALSGGGSGGAFSVGVLSAWTRQGDRPQFDVVTGVSTGALIAPFAFLGPVHDRELRDLYLGGQASRLIDFNWKTGGIFGASLLKGQALRTMVEAHVTSVVLEKIAAEHRKGRRLFIVTTNLDSQKAVTWNMGAIANSGGPEALALFQNVMIASASIPGVFPAVMIKAKAGHATIEEMHSDGGSSMQFFTLPEAAFTSSHIHLPGEKRFYIYVIVNNALIPEFETVDNRTFSVMGRAYAVLVKSQTRQGLLALYNFAKRSRSELKIASIDKQIPYSALDPFNQNYMTNVFLLGYNQTLEGRVWQDRPSFTRELGTR